MTSEDQEHYEAYFDLFMTKGWKQFVKFAEESKDRIYNIEEIRDEKTLYAVQGQIHILTNVINFEEMNQNAFEAIKAEEIESQMEEDLT